MTTTKPTPDMSEILRGLTYPSEKWQITTCADLYGADIHTRRQLYDLPPGVYESATDVADALG